ncbi:MAG: hypothetical protein AAF390_13090 [Pseudomonadota bacterium]
MGRSLGPVRLAAFLASLAAGPTLAHDKSGNHTLRSGFDIVRIELRELRFMRVARAGDPSSSGELHRVTVRLSSMPANQPVQHHEYTETAPSILNASTNSIDNSAYVAIDRGHEVTFLAEDDPEHRFLWVHSYDFHFGDSTVRSDGSPSRFQVRPEFTLEVEARDLDCRRSNICNRGDTGRVTMTFQLPRGQLNTGLDFRCNRDQEVELLRVDGQPTMLPAVPSNWFIPRIERDRDYFRTRISYSGDGPQLVPIQARFCFVKTSGRIHPEFWDRQQNGDF